MPSLIATGANQALLSELLGKYKEASFQKSLQEARVPGRAIFQAKRRCPMASGEFWM